VTDAYIADFDAVLTRRAAGGRFTAAVAVTRGEQTIFSGAYGYASRTWKVPCTLDIRFDTASITKLFTAVATLQLVERGEFGLHDSVVDYVRLTGTTISPDVTAYHLLTHTSGVADDADEESGERYEDLFVNEPNYAFRQTADHLPHFATKPPNFPPGKGCRYCNSGYLLLGLMVEQATGRPYREYVQHNVFEPAGMTRTGFFCMDVVEPDVAEGVEPILDADAQLTGWRRNVYAYPPIGDPAGGAYVTVADLLAFHRALRAGRLLGPELTAAIFTPYEVHSTKADRTRMTGYGFEFTVDSEGRIRNYYKEGVNVGTSGLLRHYPAHDLTLAILGIGEDAVWEPVRAFDDAIPDPEERA